MPSTRPLPTRRALLRLCAQGLAGAAIGPAVTGALWRQRPARARRMILLHMRGGPAPMDTFDPKPRLQSDPRGRMPSPFRFRRHGESGAAVSEIFPQLAGTVDRLCFLHGVQGDAPDHGGATLALHTGSAAWLRPSLGARVAHAFGAQHDPPAFVDLAPPAGPGGALTRAAAGLPPWTRGVALDPHAPRRTDPRALRVADESAAMRRRYGLDDAATSAFAHQCLAARRLLEAGARFVQCASGGWDAHRDLRDGHRRAARAVDRPIAALLADLDARGLLEDTLVLWAGEFGRTPRGTSGRGRAHQADGFTVWLAGGGVRAGHAHGATDPWGERAVTGRVHQRDLHATLLHLFGVDHATLEERPAAPAPRVIREILA